MVAKERLQVAAADVQAAFRVGLRRLVESLDKTSKELPRTRAL